MPGQALGGDRGGRGGGVRGLLEKRWRRGLRLRLRRRRPRARARRVGPRPRVALGRRLKPQPPRRPRPPVGSPRRPVRGRRGPGPDPWLDAQRRERRVELLERARVQPGPGPSVPLGAAGGLVGVRGGERARLGAVGWEKRGVGGVRGRARAHDGALAAPPRHAHARHGAHARTRAPAPNRRHPPPFSPPRCALPCVLLPYAAASSSARADAASTRGPRRAPDGDAQAPPSLDDDDAMVGAGAAAGQAAGCDADCVAGGGVGRGGRRPPQAREVCVRKGAPLADSSPFLPPATRHDTARTLRHG